MAYFGKEFVFEREENYEEFLKAVEAAEGNAKLIMEAKPNKIIEKDGDSYKLIFKAPGGDHVVVFKAGEPFPDAITEGLEATSTITVDGDTFNQVMDFGDRGTLSFKREFTDSTLKVTITSDKWDGVAYRYYKA